MISESKMDTAAFKQKTRAQWERSIVLHGSPAAEVAAEDLPEQIQLW